MMKSYLLLWQGGGRLYYFLGLLLFLCIFFAQSNANADAASSSTAVNRRPRTDEIQANYYNIRKRLLLSVRKKPNTESRNIGHDEISSLKIGSAFPIPRGGGGALSSSSSIMMISPYVSLKIFTTVYLLQGTLCLLAPRFNSRLYGIPTTANKRGDTTAADIIVAFLMRGCGTLMLGLGLVAWLLRNNRPEDGTMDTSVAMALSYVPIVSHQIFSMVVGVPGIPAGTFAVGITLGAVCSALPLLAHYTSTNTVTKTVATNYLKCYMAFGAMNGAAGALVPSIFMQFWKLEGKVLQAPATQTLLRTACTWCLGYCICCSWLLMKDDDASLIRAIGYGSLPAFLLLLGGNLITKEFQKLGMDRRLMAFWFVYNIIVLTPMLV